MFDVGLKTNTQYLRFLPWLMLLLSSVGVPYQFLLQSSTTVMIPMLKHTFAIEDIGIGFLTSSFFYAYLLLQVPAGLMVDRYGVRLTLSIGMLLCALSCVLLAFSQGLVLAVCSRMLMGAVTAPTVAAAMYIASRWFPIKRFPMLVGVSEMVGLLGGALGETSLAPMVLHIGWRRTLLICATVGMLLAMLIGIGLRNYPPLPWCAYFKVQHGNNCQYRMKALLNSFVNVIHNRQVWLIGLFSGLTFALLPAFAGLWAVPFLQVKYGLHLVKAALASSMIFLGAALGAPFWGFLGEHVRFRTIMFLATLVNFIATLLFLWVGNVSTWFIFVLLTSIGFLSGVYVLSFALVRDIVSESVRASAMGLTNMLCVLVGSLLLQPFIGFLIKLHHHTFSTKKVTAQVTLVYQHALLVLPVCLLLAFITIIFIRPCSELAG